MLFNYIPSGLKPCPFKVKRYAAIRMVALQSRKPLTGCLPFNIRTGLRIEWTKANSQ